MACHVPTLNAIDERRFGSVSAEWRAGVRGSKPVESRQLFTWEIIIPSANPCQENDSCSAKGPYKVISSILAIFRQYNLPQVMIFQADSLNQFMSLEWKCNRIRMYFLWERFCASILIKLWPVWSRFNWPTLGFRGSCWRGGQLLQRWPTTDRFDRKPLCRGKRNGDDL